MVKPSPDTRAILQSLFVTFLWSTSWVLVKIGLEDIPPITFAGLRYLFAFLILLPFYLRSHRTVPLTDLTRSDWGWLILLGLLFYTLTQGSQFLGLAYLPAITFSLLLNSTALIVAVLGIPLLGERLKPLQWGGMLVFLMGVVVFFYPIFIPAGMAFGFLVAGFHVLATSFSSIVGRFINRAGKLDALTVTVVSMGIGAPLLLAAGLLLEDMPRLDMTGWLIVIWLAAVNTAFAFTLWNHTLRTLSAARSSMINNTMLIQIAVLAWIFLGERVTWQEAAGLGLAAAGVFLVTWQRRPSRAKDTEGDGGYSSS
ncbi:MAG: DMT family transporter [Anaerolineae bacterium]|nr:DMT family transporter [Anaerolineae bacterium]